jgi:hypothetical protein
MPEQAVVDLDLAEMAASSLVLARRAEQMLTVLRRPAQSEATGTDRALPPLGPSGLPFPVEELPGWAECLIPAGYRDGLATALSGPRGRHMWRRPGRSLAITARPVGDAYAGVVMSADGSAEPLPGMDRHPVLAAGSPALAAACADLAAALVLVSPAVDLNGLTPPGAQGPGPLGGRPLEPAGRPRPRRRSTHRRRPRRAHPRRAGDADAHSGCGVRGKDSPLRTVWAGARRGETP